MSRKDTVDRLFDVCLAAKARSRIELDAAIPPIAANRPRLFGDSLAALASGGNLRAATACRAPYPVFLCREASLRADSPWRAFTAV
ncbi:hypothetical protein H6F89_00060 [Cyanobacteria bacterium FACHB-63]|nr:hypothetical protein [Cyanobacteria bacterium FACHB-63]